MRSLLTGLLQSVVEAIERQAQTVSCESVANHFLECARQEGRALTALQVTYLLYLAHGWHLAYFDRPLLNELVWAGRQGIQLLGFDGALRKHGTAGIREAFRSGPRPCDYEFSPALSQEAMALLNQVWVNYARFSGQDLLWMCTRPGSPWAKAWNGQTERSVPDAAIQAHFAAQLEHPPQGPTGQPRFFAHP